MMWNRKQAPAQHFPVRVMHEVILSPAEQAGQRTASAAWPTGWAHLWLKRAPSAIALPAELGPKKIRLATRGRSR